MSRIDEERPAVQRNNQETFSQSLLGWYDRHRRELPWRAAPGETADPYRVWLSEIMLQQTTVATVGPYFEKFLNRWPTIEDLAASDLDDVLTGWAGLGYYSRARNLHKCAQAVCNQYQGRFPSSEEALLKLPGIGPYTAAAIAAIAFDQRSNVVDGNVERVVSRLLRICDPLPDSKGRIREGAAGLLPDTRSGDYAQALMDLGATICTPRNPKCLVCPVATYCEAYGEGEPGRYPFKAPKKKKPTRFGTAFLAVKGDAAVYLQRRPEKGLLGGMMEVPSSEWRDSSALVSGEECSPFNVEWSALEGTVRHTFTHFHLELRVVYARIEERRTQKCDDLGGEWVALSDLKETALPTVMKKIIRHGRAHQVIEADI